MQRRRISLLVPITLAASLAGCGQTLSDPVVAAAVPPTAATSTLNDADNALAVRIIRSTKIDASSANARAGWVKATKAAIEARFPDERGTLIGASTDEMFVVKAVGEFDPGRGGRLGSMKYTSYTGIWNSRLNKVVANLYSTESAPDIPSAPGDPSLKASGPVTFDLRLLGTPQAVALG